MDVLIELYRLLAFFSFLSFCISYYGILLLCFTLSLIAMLDADSFMPYRYYFKNILSVKVALFASFWSRQLINKIFLENIGM